MNAPMTRIAECAEVLPGYALKVRAEHEPEGIFQIVMAKHLTSYTTNRNVADMIEKSAPPQRAMSCLPYQYAESHELRITPKSNVHKYRIQAGDVLFISRGVRNCAALVQSVPDQTIASGTLYILRPKANIEGGYLAWCLNQAPVQAQISKVRTGAGTPIVQRKVFTEITIPVPSIEEQRRLVELGALMTREYQLRQQLLEETGRLHRVLGQQLLQRMTSAN
ncbi:MAG TPA: restriction endonuclease subunit S [Gammaproteobacteria bacterium]|nr:restriction endonuclease subunit S [Gammaproteobacteria bacterium]